MVPATEINGKILFFATTFSAFVLNFNKFIKSYQSDIEKIDIARAFNNWRINISGDKSS